MTRVVREFYAFLREDGPKAVPMGNMSAEIFGWQCALADCNLMIAYRSGDDPSVSREDLCTCRVARCPRALSEEQMLAPCDRACMIGWDDSEEEAPIASRTRSTCGGKQ